MSDLMFPKPKWKKRKKRHPPALIGREKGICFLCAKNGDYRQKVTEEHHVFFGNGLREVSEANGFKCNLCIQHHRTGADAVHSSRETREYLCRIFQKEYEKSHTHEEFMHLIGKNYLD